MNEIEKIACDFVKGEDSYIDIEVKPLVISQLENGGTKVVAHVVHPSGEWIKFGEAYQKPQGIELVYYTYNIGEITLEQYGCELQFFLNDLQFEEQRKFTLKHIDEGQC